MTLNAGNLKTRARKGGITVLIFLILQIGTSLVTQISMARLIEPDAFGKIAMAMFIVMIFGTIMNTQGDKYIIQTKENINEKLNVIITLELILAGVLLIMVFSLSPLITKFVVREDLTFVIKLLSLNYLAIPFQKIRASLEKDLFMFKSKLASYISQVIGGIIGVTLAIYGFGIYALIIWMISTPILDVIALLFISKFKIKLSLSKNIIAEMLSFTYPLILSSIFVYFVWNVDYYIVGYFNNYTELGYYWLAFQVSHYFLNAKTALNSVLFPTFAKVNSETEKYQVFDLIIRLTAAIYTLPALFVLIFGKYLIIFIYGAKWLPATVPLQIFFIIVIIRAIGGNAGPLLYSLGKTKQDVKLAILNAITLPIFVAVGTYYYGIIGAAVGVVVSAGLNAFYGFAKYIVPLTKKSVYYYFNNSISFLSLIIVLLLIKDTVFDIDNLYFNALFLIISICIYFVIFRTEILYLANMVNMKYKTQYAK